jgi:hypothetical protein
VDPIAAAELGDVRLVGQALQYNTGLVLYRVFPARLPPYIVDCHFNYAANFHYDCITALYQAA